jgi:hypothetical protein
MQYSTGRQRLYAYGTYRNCRDGVFSIHVQILRQRQLRNLTSVYREILEWLFIFLIFRAFPLQCKNVNIRVDIPAIPYLYCRIENNGIHPNVPDNRDAIHA